MSMEDQRNGRVGSTSFLAKDQCEQGIPLASLDPTIIMKSTNDIKGVPKAQITTIGILHKCSFMNRCDTHIL